MRKSNSGGSCSFVIAESHRLEVCAQLSSVHLPSQPETVGVSGNDPRKTGAAWSQFP